MFEGSRLFHLDVNENIQLELLGVIPCSFCFCLFLLNPLFGVLCRNDDYDYDHDDDGKLFAHGRISFVIRGMEKICLLEGYRGHGQTQNHTNRAFGTPEGGFWLGEGFGGPLSHNLDNLTYISTCTAYFYTYPTHIARPNFFKILSTPLPVGCNNIALS